MQLEMGPLDEKVERGQAETKEKDLRLTQHKKEAKRMEKMTLIERAEEKLINSLPFFASVDVNDLKKKGVARWLAVFHLVLYLSLLLYFVVSGTMTESNRKYLSIAAPTANTAVCEKIPVAITGVYLADKNGFWSTDKSFNPSAAIYQLTVTGTKVTEEQFTNVMKNFSVQLKAFGDRNSDLGVIGSQIAWGLFRANDVDSKMAIQPYAQFGQIFSIVGLFSPIFSSAAGVCQPAVSFHRATLDPVSLKLEASFPVSGPTTSPTSHPTARRGVPTPALPTGNNGISSDPFLYEFCPDQISVGKDTLHLASPTRSMSVDMVQVITAFALNFGIIDTAGLKNTYSGPNNYFGGGRVDYWIDENYPDMQEAYCYTLPGQPRACFAQVWDSLVYPVLTTDDSYSWRQVDRACECPRDAKNLVCNDGTSFTLALLFSKDNNNDDILHAGQKLQRMMQEDTVDGRNKVRSLVSGLAYTAYYLDANPSYDAWKRGDAIKDDEGKIVGIQSYEQFSANFASLGRGLSILSFPIGYYGSGADLNDAGVTLESFATSSLNVSLYSFPNTTALVMCTNTVYQPNALAAMSQTPPVSVTQPYVSCKPTLRSAFVTAAGLAAANSALASSVFLGLAVSAIVFYVNKMHKKAKIIPPARKVILLEENASKLLADNAKLLADVARINADNARINAELAQIKFALSAAQIPMPNPQPPPSRGSFGSFRSSSLSLVCDDVASTDNPMQRRGSAEYVQQVLYSRHSGSRLSHTSNPPATSSTSPPVP